MPQKKKNRWNDRRYVYFKGNRKGSKEKQSSEASSIYDNSDKATEREVVQSQVRIYWNYDALYRKPNSQRDTAANCFHIDADATTYIYSHLLFNSCAASFFFPLFFRFVHLSLGDSREDAHRHLDLSQPRKFPFLFHVDSWFNLKWRRLKTIDRRKKKWFDRRLVLLTALYTMKFYGCPKRITRKTHEWQLLSYLFFSLWISSHQ